MNEISAMPVHDSREESPSEAFILQITPGGHSNTINKKSNRKCGD